MAGVIRRFIDRSLASQRVRTAYRAASRKPVLRHLARALSRRLVTTGPRWITVPSGVNAGLELLVDPRSEVGYLRGDHEPWLQDLLLDWLRPGDEYLDVGSHIGFFAFAAARVVGPTGRVVAFEPDPDSFARLLSQRDRNHLTQIDCVAAAAWSSTGSVQFASSVGSHDGGVRGAVVHDDGAGMVVAAVRIDDHAASPRAVKVDVEGGEVEALAGARRILAAGRTHWLVEVHSDELAESVAATFRRHDYDVQQISPRHPVYTDYGQDYVIAVPRAERRSSGV